MEQQLVGFVGLWRRPWSMFSVAAVLAQLAVEPVEKPIAVEVVDMYLCQVQMEDNRQLLAWCLPL
jgi:hypothetical protein